MPAALQRERSEDIPDEAGTVQHEFSKQTTSKNDRQDRTRQKSVWPNSAESESQTSGAQVHPVPPPKAESESCRVPRQNHLPYCGHRTNRQPPQNIPPPPADAAKARYIHRFREEQYPGGHKATWRTAVPDNDPNFHPAAYARVSKVVPAPCATLPIPERLPARPLFSSSLPGNSASKNSERFRKCC